MKQNVNNLLSPYIKEHTPYSSARSLKKFDNNLCYMDANESNQTSLEYRRYPDGQPTLLKQAMARYYRVKPDQICVLRGIDEALDLTIRAFVNPSDSVLICPPTYGMYEVLSSMASKKIIKVPLENLDNTWSYSTKKIITLIKKTQPKLVFVCNPNNPTGNSIDLEAIQSIAQTMKNGILIVDEAYIEYSNQRSATELLAINNNILVMRTLSKAFGLAGLRVGCVIASENFIKVFDTIRPPYPIPSPCSEMAMDAFKNIRLDRMHSNISLTNSIKKDLTFFLKNKNFIEKVFTSDTNFLLIKTKNSGSKFVKYCASQGIQLRDRNNEPHLSDCIRITIGNQTEIIKLKTVCRKWDEVNNVKT